MPKHEPYVDLRRSARPLNSTLESTTIGSKLEGYLNKNVTDYLNSSCMDRDSVSATDADIIPTANLLGCDINVYCKVGEKLNWQRFPAQFTLSQSTDAGLAWTTVRLTTTTLF